MRLNDAGRTVQTAWDQLPDHYPGVDLDAFVVMPNHIHGIIVLTVGATPCGCPPPHVCAAPKRASTGACPYACDDLQD